MKKMYILALVAATMAFSCNKNVVEQAPVQEPVLRTFTCTIAEPDTKLAIDDATGKTTWEVGDEIFIHGKYYGPSYTVTVALAAENISADGKTATFDVDLSGITPNNAASYQCEYFAAYPADAVGGYSNGDNMYYYNCFKETNKPLMAGFIEGSTINFYNICGVLSFVVDGDYDQVSFKGNSDESIAYTYYRVKIVPSEQNYKHTRDGASSTISQSIVADGTTVNKIYFPGGASFPGGFTMSFLKGGSVVKTLSTTSDVEIPRNSYRPMGDVTAYLKDYVAPVPPATHDSSIDMTGATALDGSGNANCYIVDGSVAGNANKVFTFKAYKGNSTTGVGTVASAEILWETWNNAETVTANSVIAAVDFDKQEANDYYTMVFKMPATLHAGNALIAAKDISDNILWSWHIWIPATAITQSTYGGIYGAKEIMDRNVGALVATVAEESAADVRSYGVYYQWGRKDPFLAPATTKNGSMTYTAARMSVEESIQNPTAYIKTGSDSVKDWNTASSTTLWGTSKTEYDPCPPGYVVPTRNKSTIWWADTPLDLNAEFNTSYGWFKAGVAYDAENSTTTGYMVFPICGYIDQGSLSNLGSRAYIWSAYSSSSDLAYQIFFDGSSKSRAEQRKSRAGSVRCVAE